MQFGQVFKKCPPAYQSVPVRAASLRDSPKLRAFLLYACVDEQVVALTEIWRETIKDADFRGPLRAICDAGLAHFVLDPDDRHARAVVGAAHHAYTAGAAHAAP
jgi:hypothetical protein